jgi:hypothetical protein
MDCAAFATKISCNARPESPSSQVNGMSRRDKLIARLRSRPKDFTWEELVRLLEGLGYIEAKAGKTGGSRRRFVHPSAPLIALHKPHPGNIVKMYVIDDVLRVLTEEGLI